ncbi:MAG TPA: NUDIX domain-containing protein [Methylomirabilota bacterium]|nr:NUDIX domain-containing protein [Methylomirabilota bacterium]
MSAKFLVVVAFLIERDGCLLMLRRSATKAHAPGEWEPGSGRVESGETPVEAVHREAREETGLEVEVLDVVDTFHYYRGPAREEAIGIAFHCRALGGELRLSAEHTAAEWVPFGRIPALEVSDPLRACLAILVSRPDR